MVFDGPALMVLGLGASAALEVLIWVLGPLVVVLTVAGMGSLVVRGGWAAQVDGRVRALATPLIGFLVLIGASGAWNLFLPFDGIIARVPLVLGPVLLLWVGRGSWTAVGTVRVVAITSVVGAMYRWNFKGLSYDAALYHRSVVGWLSEPLPVGLGLYHERLAFNPSLLTILPIFDVADFWEPHAVVEVGALVAVVMAILAVLTHGALRDDRTLIAAAAALLTGLSAFLVLDGDVRGGTDLGAGAVVIAAVAFATATWRPDSGSDRVFWSAMTIAATVLAVVQKGSTAPVLVLALQPLALLVRHRTAPGFARGSGTLAASPPLLLAGGVLAVWGVRNVVMSGCLVFPVRSLCLDTTWGVGQEAAARMTLVVRSWARAGRLDVGELLEASWLLGWMLDHLRSPAFGVVLLAFAVSIPTLRYWWNPRGEATGIAVRGLLFSASGLVFWFIAAPDSRFALQYHVILAAALLLPGLERALPARWGSATPWSSWVHGWAGLTTSVAVLVIAVATVTRPTFPLGGVEPEVSPDERIAISGDIDAIGPFVVPIVGDQCGTRFPCRPSSVDIVLERRRGRLHFHRGGAPGPGG